MDDIKSHLPNDKSFPTIYLINGEFSDDEMNELYNHHKIKAMVSLTHGEGFGRPLLEFSLTGKPVIASGWSGQLDFLNKEFSILLHGELKKIHQSTVQERMLIEDSKWFYPHDNHTQFILTDVVHNYKSYKDKAKKQKEFSKK